MCWQAVHPNLFWILWNNPWSINVLLMHIECGIFCHIFCNACMNFRKSAYMWTVPEILHFLNFNFGHFCGGVNVGWQSINNIVHSQLLWKFHLVYPSQSPADHHGSSVSVFTKVVSNSNPYDHYTHTSNKHWGMMSTLCWYLLTLNKRGFNMYRRKCSGDLHRLPVNCFTWVCSRLAILWLFKTETACLYTNGHGNAKISWNSRECSHTYRYSKIFIPRSKDVAKNVTLSVDKWNIDGPRVIS